MLSGSVKVKSTILFSFYRLQFYSLSTESKLQFFVFNFSSLEGRAGLDRQTVGLLPPRTGGRLSSVESPSRDSLDGDKSSSMHPTPNFNSPVESPSHHSFGCHSKNSSSSRLLDSRGFLGPRQGGNEAEKGMIRIKGWPECNVIVEEDYEDENGFSHRFQTLIGLLSFVLLFTVLCLIIWGATRPFKAEVAVKSLAVNNLYIGTGSDFTGVPTKMLTVNGSLRLSIYNPVTFFGIRVSSTPVNLIYSVIVVATGQD